MMLSNKLKRNIIKLEEGFNGRRFQFNLIGFPATSCTYKYMIRYYPKSFQALFRWETSCRPRGSFAPSLA